VAGLSRDGAVLFALMPPLKSLRPLSKHSQKNLLSPSVDTSSHLVQQLRLFNYKVDLGERSIWSLKFEDRKPAEPVRDVVGLIGVLKC
jgi:hypothetical protein